MLINAGLPLASSCRRSRRGADSTAVQVKPASPLSLFTMSVCSAAADELVGRPMSRAWFQQGDGQHAHVVRRVRFLAEMAAAGQETSASPPAPAPVLLLDRIDRAGLVFEHSWCGSSRAAYSSGLSLAVATFCGSVIFSSPGSSYTSRGWMCSVSGDCNSAAVHLVPAGGVSRSISFTACAANGSGSRRFRQALAPSRFEVVRVEREEHRYQLQILVNRNSLTPYAAHDSLRSPVGRRQAYSGGSPRLFSPAWRRSTCQRTRP